MTAILLVEDEENIAAPLRSYLEEEGFQVSIAPSLAAARAAWSAKIALVILDWMLPDGQGIALLKEWRQAGYRTPIIMLTARHELIDKVLGLELGADDYLTKPFATRELLARIRARLRQQQDPSSAAVIWQHAGIVLNDQAHTVSFHDKSVELTRMEYALLKLFMEHVNTVFSRDEILNRVWGFDAMPTTRTVDTHVLQLRQKLAPDLFETVRGIGYRMP